MPTKPTTRAQFIGDRIRQARDEAGLNNSSLARHSGLDRRLIVRVANGRNVPKQEALERIASATGKPLDYFRADGEQNDVGVYAPLLRELRRLVDMQVDHRLQGHLVALEETVAVVAQLDAGELGIAVEDVRARITLALSAARREDFEAMLVEIDLAISELTGAIEARKAA